MIAGILPDDFYQFCEKDSFRRSKYLFDSGKPRTRFEKFQALMIGNPGEMAVWHAFYSQGIEEYFACKNANITRPDAGYDCVPKFLFPDKLSNVKTTPPSIPGARRDFCIFGESLNSANADIYISVTLNDKSYVIDGWQKKSAWTNIPTGEGNIGIRKAHLRTDWRKFGEE